MLTLFKKHQILNPLKKNIKRDRFSHPDVLCQKNVLKNFSKFRCARVSFLIMLQDNATFYNSYFAFFLWIHLTVILQKNYKLKLRKCFEQELKDL